MSSDEEECYGYYWNNWKIPDEEDSTSEDKTSKISFHDGNEISISKINYGPEFGNWIPPLHLSNRSKNTSLRKLALNRSLQRNKNAAQVAFVNTQSRKYIDSAQQHNLNSTLKNDLKWEKILNCDWGERVELHDMTNFSDGDLMWGVVALGTFAHIKLWINDYGNICGFADGKISKEGTTETTLILITNAQLLRKMLNITNAQWSSLIEITQKNKLTLAFDALSDNNLMQMNSLEKLWFYTCKRRHFLPDQCMLVKFCGAVKSFKELKIIPKLVVQDIRDISGNEIP